MKKHLLSVFLISLFLSTMFFVSAEEPDEFSLNLNDEFTCVYKNDDKTYISEKFGMSNEELDKYFKNNNVLMIAVNSDNTFQVRLLSYKNNFSELAENLTLLDDDEIIELSSYLVGTQENLKILMSNGKKFISFSETHNDSGGRFTSTQFITICNGKVFQFSCLNSGNSTESQVYNIFNSLVINESSSAENVIPLWKILLIVLGITIFFTLAVAMLIGIIREKKIATTVDEN